MSKISGKETKPEILVRKFLFSKGFRYRKNDESLPGKPDIVLRKYNTIIFVHGCFWHGHNCKAAKLPETRKDFWEMKIIENRKRDKKQQDAIRKLGWNLIIIWQCEIKSKILLKQRCEILVNEIVRKQIRNKQKISENSSCKI